MTFIFGYFGVHLPKATHELRDVIKDVDPHLEEAYELIGISIFVLIQRAHELTGILIITFKKPADSSAPSAAWGEGEGGVGSRGAPLAAPR